MVSGKWTPIKWRSLTENINQSRSCVRSSFSPREGCINLTEVLSQSEKRCSKSIKSLEGDRSYDPVLNQSVSKLKFTHPQGQNKSFSNQFCSVVNSYSVGQSHSDLTSPINASALLGNTAVRENLLDFVENFDAAPIFISPSTPAPIIVEMALANPPRSRPLLRYTLLQTVSNQAQRNRQGPPRIPLQSIASSIEKCCRRRLAIRARQQRES